MCAVLYQTSYGDGYRSDFLGYLCTWIYNLAFGSVTQAPLEATADVEHPLSHMCHIVRDHRPKLAGQSQPKPASSIYSIHCAVSSPTLAVLMPWGYMQVLVGLLLISKTKCCVCPSIHQGMFPLYAVWCLQLTGCLHSLPWPRVVLANTPSARLYIHVKPITKN